MGSRFSAQSMFESPPIVETCRTTSLRRHHHAKAMAWSPWLLLSIMSMIPRMPNLVSLSLYDCDMYTGFLSTLGNCLKQSSVKQVSLWYFFDFRLSILDNGQNIKKLTFSHCKGMEEPNVDSSLPHLSLESLAISGHNSHLLFWSSYRVSSLITLELRKMAQNMVWTGYPELIAACSNSLKRLYLSVMDHCM